MSDIDRQIAERLGWRVEYAIEHAKYQLVMPTGQIYLWKDTEEAAWGNLPEWDRNIGAALGLVEELKLYLTLEVFPGISHATVREGISDFDKWMATELTPAAAVARAILAWLEAKEAGR